MNGVLRILSCCKDDRELLANNRICAPASNELIDRLTARKNFSLLPCSATQIACGWRKSDGDNDHDGDYCPDAFLDLHEGKLVLDASKDITATLDAVMA